MRDSSSSARPYKALKNNLESVLDFELSIIDELSNQGEFAKEISELAKILTTKEENKNYPITKRFYENPLEYKALERTCGMTFRDEDKRKMILCIITEKLQCKAEKLEIDWTKVDWPFSYSLSMLELTDNYQKLNAIGLRGVIQEKLSSDFELGTRRGYGKIFMSESAFISAYEMMDFNYFYTELAFSDRNRVERILGKDYKSIINANSYSSLEGEIYISSDLYQQIIKEILEARDFDSLPYFLSQKCNVFKVPEHMRKTFDDNFFDALGLVFFSDSKKAWNDFENYIDSISAKSFSYVIRGAEIDGVKMVETLKVLYHEDIKHLNYALPHSQVNRPYVGVELYDKKMI